MTEDCEGPEAFPAFTHTIVPVDLPALAAGEDLATEIIENLLMKVTSTSSENTQEAKGELPIDFEENRRIGSAPLPQVSSPEGSGARPPLTLYLESGDDVAPRPSPCPDIAKRRRLCPPNPRDYAAKNKEELKSICRSKNLKLSGLKEDLLERLEKADKGQTKLVFPINVPPKLTYDGSESSPLKRKRTKEDEEESIEMSRPSFKGARREEDIYDGGGRKKHDVGSSIVGGEGVLIREITEETLFLIRRKQ